MTPRYSKCITIQKQYTPPPITIQPTDEFEPINNSAPEFYCISISGQDLKPCSVFDCPFQTDTPHCMWEHFQRCHIKDNVVVIAEEGQLPRCLQCGIFQQNIGPAHQVSL
jgi:hypothetical protein